MQCTYCREPATHEIHQLTTGLRKPVCRRHVETVFDCNRPVELYPLAAPTMHETPDKDVRPQGDQG